MRIKQEGNRMILKNYNIQRFIFGFIFAAIGISTILYSVLKHKPILAQIIVIICGSIFALVGILVILMTKMVTIVLEKGNKCSFLVRTLIGKELKECNVSEIKELRLERFYTLSEGQRVQGVSFSFLRYYYVLNFVLKNGQELRFEFGSTSSINTLSETKKIEARMIAGFLGVPLVEINPPLF